MVYQKNVLSIDKITVSSQIRGSICSGIDPMGVNMLRNKVSCLKKKGSVSAGMTDVFCYTLPPGEGGQLSPEYPGL